MIGGRGLGRDVLPMALLAAAWTALTLLVDPVGDFPLNDDWAYAYTVRSLLRSGRFELSDWNSTSFVAQAYWGALFCLPFGFSFTALRASTLVAGGLGVLAVHWSLRSVGATMSQAILGALLVAVNPLYFQLSHTFMTEVPFVALAMAAWVLLLRSLERDEPWALLAGSVLTVAATLVRQLGIVIGVAFGVVYVIKRGTRWRSLLVASLPALLALLALHAYEVSLWRAQASAPSYGAPAIHFLRRFSVDPVAFVAAFSKRAFLYASYLGAFVFPALVQNGRARRPVLTRRTGIACGVALVLAVAWMLVHPEWRLPRLGNLILDLAAGPMTLSGVSPWLRAPPGFWLFVTAAGLAGSGWLLLSLAAAWRETAGQGGPTATPWSLTLALVTLLCYLGPVSLFPKGYDRYLVLAPPLLVVLSVLAGGDEGTRAPRPRWRVATAFGLVALLGAYSLAATHDYMSWNRARWQALTHLLERERVAPIAIDGGFEFDGWYGLNVMRQEAGRSTITQPYVVTLHPLRGYRVMARFPFRVWLPPGTRNAVALERKE